MLFMIALGMSLCANVKADDPPRYEIESTIDIVDDVTRTTLVNNPWALEVSVPPQFSDQYSGFNIGIFIVPKDDRNEIVLDSVRITQCAFSIYHLDVETGTLTPVKLPDGKDAVNISPSRFSMESETSRPSVYTLDQKPFVENVGKENSPNHAEVIGTPVSNVGAIGITKQKITWGIPSDLTRPTKGKGYVVKWTVKLIPTYQGVEYPEIDLSFNDRLTFKYVVEEVGLPIFVRLTPPSDPIFGETITYAAHKLEFFELQYSADLLEWKPIKYDAVRDSYRGGTIYRWDLSQLNLPLKDGRRFYRMVWTPKPGFQHWPLLIPPG